MRRTHQARTDVLDAESRREAVHTEKASMQRAQDLARDILNLSQSDLDDIMSADGEQHSRTVGSFCLALSFAFGRS